MVELAAVEEVHHQIQLRLRLEGVTQTGLSFSAMSAYHTKNGWEMPSMILLSASVCSYWRRLGITDKTQGNSMIWDLFITFIAYILPVSFMRTYSVIPSGKSHFKHLSERALSDRFQQLKIVYRQLRILFQRLGS